MSKPRASEEWRCQHCHHVEWWRGSSSWPATWPVTLWCRKHGGEALHDRLSALK